MNDFDQQEAILQERRKAYAQQLQGLQTPQGRMVGNTYVAANPLEYLAAGLRGVGGQGPGGLAGPWHAAVCSATGRVGAAAAGAGGATPGVGPGGAHRGPPPAPRPLLTALSVHLALRCPASCFALRNPACRLRFGLRARRLNPLLPPPFLCIRFLGAAAPPSLDLILVWWCCCCTTCALNARLWLCSTACVSGQQQ